MFVPAERWGQTATHLEWNWSWQPEGEIIIPRDGSEGATHNSDVALTMNSFSSSSESMFDQIVP